MNRNPLFHSHRATRLMLTRRNTSATQQYPKCPVRGCPNNMYSHRFICGECEALVPSALKAALHAEPSMVVENGHSVFNRKRDALKTQMRQAAEDARASRATGSR